MHSGDIRVGLLRGRIRNPRNLKPSRYHPSFEDALGIASNDDLAYAMTFLIKNSASKRTYREERMKMIANKMMVRLNEVATK